LSTASASARGIDADDVLPVRSSTIAALDIGMPIFCAADSMMRTFAWCGTNRSMSSGWRPDRRIDSRAVVAIVFVANR
jgi:hypothetical protein